MLREILVAFIIVSINVSIHAIGRVELFKGLTRKQPEIEKKLSTVENIFLFIEIFEIILSLHLAQMCIWAGFYAVC